jgi:hypothetical protein
VRRRVVVRQVRAQAEVVSGERLDGIAWPWCHRVLDVVGREHLDVAQHPPHVFVAGHHPVIDLRAVEHRFTGAGPGEERIGIVEVRRDERVELGTQPGDRALPGRFGVAICESAGHETQRRDDLGLCKADLCVD